MLQVTSNAAHHLARVRQARGVDVANAARFVGNGGQIQLTFTSSPERGDQMIETSEIPVFLAPDVASRLDQAVMDTRQEGGEDLLVIRPTAAAPRDEE